MNTQIETDIDILIEKLVFTGLDILIKILKKTFNARITNIKCSSIPLQQRKYLIIKTILEHIVRDPDETLSRKIFDIYFPKKVRIKPDSIQL